MFVFLGSINNNIALTDTVYGFFLIHNICEEANRDQHYH